MAPTLLLFLALISNSPSTPPASDASQRMRPLDRTAATIAGEAARRSPTAADLMAAVERSSVVVYLRTGVALPTRGVLNLVGCGGGLTYVAVKIDLKQPSDERIAVLAHELTHAVEIADAPSRVCDERALAALYRRVGTRGAHDGDVESATAIANERQARADQRIAAALPCDRVHAVPRTDPPPCSVKR